MTSSSSNVLRDLFSSSARQTQNEDEVNLKEAVPFLEPQHALSILLRNHVTCDEQRMDFAVTQAWGSLLHTLLLEANEKKVANTEGNTAQQSIKKNDSRFATSSSTGASPFLLLCKAALQPKSQEVVGFFIFRGILVGDNKDSTVAGEGGIAALRNAQLPIEDWAQLLMFYVRSLLFNSNHASIPSVRGREATLVGGKEGTEEGRPKDPMLQLGLIFLIQAMMAAVLTHNSSVYRSGKERKSSPYGDMSLVCVCSPRFALLVSALFSDLVPALGILARQMTHAKDEKENCSKDVEETTSTTKNSCSSTPVLVPTRMATEANNTVLLIFSVVSQSSLMLVENPENLSPAQDQEDKSKRNLPVKKPPLPALHVVDKTVPQSLASQISSCLGAIGREREWFDRCPLSASEILHQSTILLEDFIREKMKLREKCLFLAHQSIGKGKADGERAADDILVQICHCLALWAPRLLIRGSPPGYAWSKCEGARIPLNSLSLEILELLNRVKQLEETENEGDVFNAVYLLGGACIMLGMKGDAKVSRVLQAQPKFTQGIHDLIVIRLLHYKDEAVSKLSTCLSSCMTRPLLLLGGNSQLSTSASLVVRGEGAGGTSGDVASPPYTSSSSPSKKLSNKSNVNCFVDIATGSLMQVLESRDAASHLACNLIADAAIQKPHLVLPQLFRYLAPTMDVHCRKNALQVLGHVAAKVEENLMQLVESEEEEEADDKDEDEKKQNQGNMTGKRKTRSSPIEEVTTRLAQELLARLEDEELLLRTQTSTLFSLVPFELVAEPLLRRLLLRHSTCSDSNSSEDQVGGHTDEKRRSAAQQALVTVLVGCVTARRRSQAKNGNKKAAERWISLFEIAESLEKEQIKTETGDVATGNNLQQSSPTTTTARTQVLQVPRTPADLTAIFSPASSDVSSDSLLKDEKKEEISGGKKGENRGGTESTVRSSAAISTALRSVIRAAASKIPSPAHWSQLLPYIMEKAVELPSGNEAAMKLYALVSEYLMCCTESVLSIVVAMMTMPPGRDKEVSTQTATLMKGVDEDDLTSFPRWKSSWVFHALKEQNFFVLVRPLLCLRPAPHSFFQHPDLRDAKPASETPNISNGEEEEKSKRKSFLLRKIFIILQASIFGGWKPSETSASLSEKDHHIIPANREEDSVFESLPKDAQRLLIDVLAKFPAGLVLNAVSEGFHCIDSHRTRGDEILLMLQAELEKNGSLSSFYKQLQGTLSAWCTELRKPLFLLSTHIASHEDVEACLREAVERDGQSAQWKQEAVSSNRSGSTCKRSTSLFSLLTENDFSVQLLSYIYQLPFSAFQSLQEMQRLVTAGLTAIGTGPSSSSPTSQQQQQQQNTMLKEVAEMKEVHLFITEEQKKLWHGMIETTGLMLVTQVVLFTLRSTSSCKEGGEGTDGKEGQKYRDPLSSMIQEVDRDEGKAHDGSVNMRASPPRGGEQEEIQQENLMTPPLVAALLSALRQVTSPAAQNTQDERKESELRKENEGPFSGVTFPLNFVTDVLQTSIFLAKKKQSCGRMFTRYFMNYFLEPLIRGANALAASPEPRTTTSHFSAIPRQQQQQQQQRWHFSAQLCTCVFQAAAATAAMGALENAHLFPLFEFGVGCVRFSSKSTEISFEGLKLLAALLAAREDVFNVVGEQMWGPFVQSVQSVADMSTNAQEREFAEKLMGLVTAGQSMS